MSLKYVSSHLCTIMWQHVRVIGAWGVDVTLFDRRLHLLGKILSNTNRFLHEWQAMSGTQIHRPIQLQWLSINLSHIVKVYAFSVPMCMHKKTPRTAKYSLWLNNHCMQHGASHGNCKLLKLCPPLRDSVTAFWFLGALTYDPFTIVCLLPYHQNAMLPDSFANIIEQLPNLGYAISRHKFGNNIPPHLHILIYATMQLCQWAEFFHQLSVVQNCSRWRGYLSHVLIHLCLYHNLWKYVNIAYIPQTHWPAAGKSYCLLFAGFPGTDEFYHVYRM